jgi:D-psicose/D-tagatose/L-ribulose 3-epimerase
VNLLGVHALVWAGDWSEASARHAIASTAAAGYDLIEIPVLDPSTVDTAMTKRLLDEYGIAATCSLGLTLDADVSSPDPYVARRGFDVLSRALDVTREIGGSYLGGVIYSAMAKYPGPATAPGRANCVDALRRLAADAASDGITIGLEVVNRYESNLLNTAAQAVPLLAEIGADNAVVHLDTYHMNIEETDFATPVEASGARLGYVHVGESNRGYLGSGTVNFGEFFRALEVAGYAGPVTFESFSSAVVDPTLSNTLAIWRNLWDDGMDLATKAREYVRAGLAAD